MEDNHPPADAVSSFDPRTCITCSDQAIPARVRELLPGGLALVEVDGKIQEADITLIDAAPGDTIFLHADVAIAKLTEGSNTHA